MGCGRLRSLDPCLLACCLEAWPPEQDAYLLKLRSLLSHASTERSRKLSLECVLPGLSARTPGAGRGTVQSQAGSGSWCRGPGTACK